MEIINKHYIIIKLEAQRLSELTTNELKTILNLVHNFKNCSVEPLNNKFKYTAFDIQSELNIREAVVPTTQVTENVDLEESEEINIKHMRDYIKDVKKENFFKELILVIYITKKNDTTIHTKQSQSTTDMV